MHYVFFFAAAFCASLPLFAEEVKPGPVLIDTGFEDASLGRIEVLDAGRFRLHIAGQADETGHNRQASWYYFRMNRVANRDLTLILTDYLGEYDGKPGAVPMNDAMRPVYSTDGEHWDIVPDFHWDPKADEVTIHLHLSTDSVWLAHVVPYPFSRLENLLHEIGQSPMARVETIGRSAEKRDLSLVTITDATVPDPGKKVVWLITREHAWESGTSFAAEGALRFLISEDENAKRLRRENVFYLSPMVDPDGCATGKVRYNAHGFDVNRHWEEVDLRDKRWLTQTPEIWYTKQAVLDRARRQPIDLVVNLHNNETNEYLETMMVEGPGRQAVDHLFALLRDQTTFAPSRDQASVVPNPARPSTNVLWRENHIPVVLIEQRITPSPKLGHIATP